MNNNIIPASDLKACPFCGEIPQHVKLDGRDFTFNVSCENIHCNNGHLSPMKAIEYWNKLPDEKEFTIDMKLKSEQTSILLANLELKKDTYHVITYTWEKDGVKHFEMDVHDGDASDFLKSVEDDSEKYTIISTHQISKKKYDLILGEM